MGIRRQKTDSRSGVSWRSMAEARKCGSGANSACSGSIAAAFIPSGRSAMNRCGESSESSRWPMRIFGQRPGRNRPHPPGRDPQEPQGPRLSSHSGALRQAGRAPGPAVTAATPAHGDRKHGTGSLPVCREQRRRVADLGPSHELEPPSPSVSIQWVTADGKVYEMDQRPEFLVGTSNIQINHAAISLLNPEAIRFHYKLRGVDDEWHEAGRATSVNYRNLVPGSYRLQVDASDANGLWSDKTATSRFTILPAYYQTIGFGLSALASSWQCCGWSIGCVSGTCSDGSR